MEHEARQVGKACDLAYAGDNPDRTKAIEEHVRRIANGDPKMRGFIAKATDTLMSRLLLSPIDVLVEWRVWNGLQKIRPNQTVSLYLHARQKRNPLDQAQVAHALPEMVKRTHETGAAAWAIFIDHMCGGRTAYAVDHAHPWSAPGARTCG